MGYVFVIDFESFGGSTAVHGFSAVGAVLVRDDGHLVGSFRSYANQDGLSYDEDCVENFWKKLPGDHYAKVLAECQSAPSCKDVVEQMMLYFEDVIKKENVDVQDIVYVGDCIEYDIGLLRYYLSPPRDVKRLFGKYAEWICTGSYGLGMGLVPLTSAAVRLTSSKGTARSVVFKHLPDWRFTPGPAAHDHDPLHDALSISHSFLEMRAAVTAINGLVREKSEF